MARLITEKIKLEMVHDRVATRVTRVVRTAVVLRCGKQKEKLPHYYFSWIVSFRNGDTCRMLPMETKTTLPLGSPGGGGLFLEETPRGRS